MPGTVGQIERKTQQRVVKLFRDTLGYHYLGNWITGALRVVDQGKDPLGLTPSCVPWCVPGQAIGWSDNRQSDGLQIGIWPGC